MQTPDHWQQVEDIFHAALERHPAERAAYLVEVCAGETEPRAPGKSRPGAAS